MLGNLRFLSILQISTFRKQKGCKILSLNGQSPPQWTVVGVQHPLLSLIVCRRTPLTDPSPFDGPSCTTFNNVRTFVSDFLKKYSKCPSMDRTDGPLSLGWFILHNYRCYQNLRFIFSKKNSKCTSMEPTDGPSSVRRSVLQNR